MRINKLLLVNYRDLVIINSYNICMCDKVSEPEIEQCKRGKRLYLLP